MDKIVNIHYAIQMGLLFVLFVTGSWRKSYSTTVLVLVTLVAFFNIPTCQGIWQHYMINGVSFIMVIRAIIQSEYDQLIKRG